MKENTAQSLNDWFKFNLFRFVTFCEALGAVCDDAVEDRQSVCEGLSWWF